MHNVVGAKSTKIMSFRVTKGNVHHSEKLGPMTIKVAEEQILTRYLRNNASTNARGFIKKS